MPVGAMIGVGALSAGTSLLGAHEASNASKNAAQVQQDSAAKALDLQKSIYDSQVARAQPYANAGAAALDNLMSTHYGTPFSDQIAGAVAGGKAAVGIPTLGGLARQAGPLPPPTSPAPPMAGPIGAPGAPMGQPGPPMGQPGAPTVRMVSPNGEAADVPQQYVQQFLAKGARVVGGGPVAPGSMAPNAPPPGNTFSSLAARPAA